MEISVVISQKQPSQQQPSGETVMLTLQPRPQLNRVTWAPDTVNNEFHNKKKSNKCCIYKKPRKFGESSSSSSGEDTSDSSDSENT